ncbi:citrate lyase subunit beta/citryl-CoA lyase [Cryobacterium sp. MP_M5]|uniref:HpcH/HpaI aldolase/citrate lyase family protein n=1 Tax=unclassified Cryobacterium TaxID=2649013 RepID=UPI0018CB073B|nr:MULTISPECIES: CoA ester lyase [unclassified Cryobacterium]MBG6057436.1 citrate lyase subunit beta/citryl-CoA lyase [Cryobacterium sp. MP_M3]MEC5175635.1 citrate lyase subunit beta/citryl-CoA lyase [Cryobacterium sp. MP_M5]
MSFDLGPALLFCPADRPDRYRKAADRADAVIIDLEDAILPANRARARGALIGHPLDPERTIVRVNPVGTPDFALDLAALEETAYRTVMLPKTVDGSQVRPLARFEVVALCETAAGVLAAPSIAAEPNVVALMWGADDLVASLDGSSSRFADGSYRAVARHARSAVLLAAGAHGKAAVDGVFLAIPDLAGLAAEVADAVASGFRATACIHPSQVAVIRDAFRPTEEEVAAAWALLEAAAGEDGVFAYQGRMIDSPLLRHAEAVLRRAAPTDPRGAVTD